MQIAFHLGAHCTDSHLLVPSLRRNLDRMDGVAVPETDRYHALLRDVVNELQGRPATQVGQEAILDRILETEEPRRVVLSNSSFLCVPDRAIEDGALYPLAHKAAWLAGIFPDHEVSFHICVRNPAFFIPHVFHVQDATEDLVSFLGTRDPARLRWSEPIAAILKACPRARLTLWCYEDSPLIWGKVMKAVAGLPKDAHLHGLYDHARDVMTKDGMAKLRAYTSAKPPKTEAARQQVCAAFMDRFGREEDLRPLPLDDTWTDGTVERLTALYEEDLARILAFDRVHVLTR